MFVFNRVVSHSPRVLFALGSVGLGGFFPFFLASAYENGVKPAVVDSASLR